MKIKVLIAVCLLSAAALATTIQWNPVPADEQVHTYYLEHRATDQTVWTRVEVAATQHKIVIPESAYGRWFRIAAVNDFGVSEWTTPVKLPSKVTGLSLILEITP